MIGHCLLAFSVSFSSFVGIRFFYRRAYELLKKMFLLESDHVLAAFLNPNYKQLRGATPTQIADCYHRCRLFFAACECVRGRRG